MGRQAELAELNGHLEKALAGQGQVCFVTGEAGAGKTALVRQFVQQALAASPELVVAMGSCNAQTGVGDPYLPFREALAMLTGDSATQSSASKVTPENANRLRTVLVRSVQVLVEIAPDLIGVLVPGGKLVAVMGKTAVTKAGWMDQLERLAKQPAAPTVDQNHILEQYTAFLQRLSAKTPLILFLDDLQWADGASIGLLFHLGRRIETNRILVLGAYRPNDVALGRKGERHPLEPVVHELMRYYGDVMVDLDAIPEAAGRRFVDALLDAEGNALGEDFRQALFHQTDGHALFTVELLQAMRERGDLVCDGQGRWTEDPSLDWDALPARVEGVIAERIARLGDDLQELLTVGSVEGETFAAEVVARVQAMPDREAIRRLSNELQRQHRLVRDLGLVQFTPVQLSYYGFVHNLFQQYLYGGLDGIERVHLHRYMGQALEAFFGERTEEVAAQLARHFEEGGVPAKAAAYRLQAGVRAHRMSAHQEAVAHLTRGLELLDGLPQGVERMQLELRLQIALGVPLVLVRGHAAPEVEKVYSRAQELCDQVCEEPQRFHVLMGLRRFYFFRGELGRAYDLGEQLLSQAERLGDPAYLSRAHAMHGETLYRMGMFSQSREHCATGYELYDPVQHRSHVFLYGNDTRVLCCIFGAVSLWPLGYPDQALAKAREAIALAEELDHPFTRCIALFFNALLHRLRREAQATQERAEAALQIATDRGFALVRATGKGLRGWALAEQGHEREGIDQIQQGIAACRSNGTDLELTTLLAHLSEAYSQAGGTEQALDPLDEAFALVERTGERFWEAELYRLQGEMLLKQGEEREAEAAFRRAIDVARGQGARSWELRAAISLARLWREQGKRTEAGELLREIYSWFSEGLDTADLREAQALLATLA